MAAVKIFLRLLCLFQVGYQYDVFSYVKSFSYNYDNMKVIKECVGPRSVFLSKCSKMPLCESIKHDQINNTCWAQQFQLEKIALDESERIYLKKSISFHF